LQLYENIRCFYESLRIESLRMNPPKRTEGELAILRVLWHGGPSMVRQVHEAINSVKKRYTTVLRLMQIMTEKCLLSRDELLLRELLAMLPWGPLWGTDSRAGPDPSAETFALPRPHHRYRYDRRGGNHPGWRIARRLDSLPSRRQHRSIPRLAPRVIATNLFWP
jgi:hypothetical protein